MERVDFHVHYNSNDKNSECCVIDRAASVGVSAVALMLRSEIPNNIDSYRKYGKRLGVEVFSGMETVSSLGDRKDIELICIGFRQKGSLYDMFSKESSKVRNIELARFERNFLNSKGFRVEGSSQEDIQLLEWVMGGQIKAKAISLCQIVSRNKINETLVEELKLCKSKVWSDVLNRYSKSFSGKDLDAKFLHTLYFSAQGECQIDPKYTAEEIIKSTHASGGGVFYSPEGKFDLKIWHCLVDFGVDGIMAWHGGKMELTMSFVKSLVGEGKVILGGGDFDPVKDDWQIGVGNGEMFISPRRTGELKRCLQKYSQNLTIGV